MPLLERHVVIWALKYHFWCVMSSSEAMPKYFGMDEAYRLPKLNSEAAELPRYRYADERLMSSLKEVKIDALAELKLEYSHFGPGHRSEHTT